MHSSHQHRSSQRKKSTKQQYYQGEEDQLPRILYLGKNITNEMKSDVIEAFKWALQQEEYERKAEKMRHKLEQQYGKSWSIVIATLESDFSQSFLCAETQLFYFEYQDYQVLAYFIEDYEFFDNPDIVIRDHRPLYHNTNSLNYFGLNRSYKPPNYLYGQPYTQTGYNCYLFKCNFNRIRWINKYQEKPIQNYQQYFK